MKGLQAPILILTDEDIHQCLIESFGWTEEEAEKYCDTITQDQVNDIAWQIAECFSMDTYWEAIEDELQRNHGIKVKENATDQPTNS